MAEDVKVPEGWRRVRLGEITDINMGQSPPSTVVNERGIGIPFLQGNAEFTTKYPISQKWAMKPLKLAKKGDILISVRAPVGAVNKADRNYCIGRGLAAISFKTIDDGFGWFGLIYWKYQLENLSQGSTFEAISKKDLKNLLLLIPTPLPEQRKIAEILETIDNAIEKTDKIIEKYKRIKQGLMQDLLTKGIDENGQIRSEETHSFKDSPLGRIPEEWEVVELGEVIIGSPQNGIYKEAKFYDRGSSYIIELDDLYRFDYKIETTKLRKIDLPNKELLKYKLSENDILINRVSKEEEGVAKALLVSKIPPNTVFESNMLRVRLDNNRILPQYFVYYADSQNYKTEKKKYALFSNQTSINQVGISLIKIPIPSLSEQKRIASILSQIDKTIEKEQKYKEKLQRIKQGLMRDLLTGKVRVNHLIEDVKGMDQKVEA